MAKAVRISILLVILLAVAVSAWKARARTTNWDETLRVVVYPINGDGSAAADSHIAALRRGSLQPLAEFMQAQARRHGLALREPVDLDLAPRVQARPPPAPQGGSALTNGLWSLQLRWWAWRHDAYAGPKPHVRVFVQYYAPVAGRALAHSIGLRQGMIVVANAFAGADHEGGNQVVIAHELLHTFGATDKYNPVDNLPLFPEGYAEPQAQPLLPQTQAELMGGRIPRAPGVAEIPRSLEQTVIGDVTAREINWRR